MADRGSPSSDLTSHTGFWMRFVSNHVLQAFAQKILRSGVTVAEWVLLRELHGLDGTTPSRRADLTGLTCGAVSKLIDRLVTRKLIARQDCDGDRRYQNLTLTIAGHRLVPALAAILDRNDEDFFSGLSRGERETLLAILIKLVQAHGLHKLAVE